MGEFAAFRQSAAGIPKQSADVLNLINNVYTSPFFRAMLDAMNAWASDGVAPPDSSYPTIEAGTLVSYADWATQFPNIPGQMLPERPLDLPLMDFGPRVAEGILSSLPPMIVDWEGYTVLVQASTTTATSVMASKLQWQRSPWERILVGIF
ncbi:hypothetical protein CDO25_23640 (plasmid) [Sinorhizobium meliloti]|nr:hypothetical protein CDO25_23640 [Sinorhizobium meliloti]